MCELVVICKKDRQNSLVSEATVTIEEASI